MWAQTRPPGSWKRGRCGTHRARRFAAREEGRLPRTSLRMMLVSAVASAVAIAWSAGAV